MTTLYPELDNYPQDHDVCMDAEWETFSDPKEYEFSFNLSTDETTVKYMWTINDGKVHGKIAFNGLFGFLAVGLADLDPNAKHNGMNRASIFMTTPSDEYDQKTGFDFIKSTRMAQHMIHKDGSSFCHWKDPITNSTSIITRLDINID